MVGTGELLYTIQQVRALTDAMENDTDSIINGTTDELTIQRLTSNCLIIHSATGVLHAGLLAAGRAADNF